MRLAGLRGAAIIASMLLTSVATAASAKGEENGKIVRVGIICDEGQAVKAEGVEALLAAGLSGSKDFQLVERQAVRKVVNEQGLAKFSDAAGAVKLGQIVGADLLVLGSAAKGGNPVAFRLRVVETKSGVILADELEDMATLTKKPEELRGAVEAAVRKAGVPVGAWKLVGVIGVSSGEIDSSLDGMAAALGVLLRIDLARSPDVVVLEREQLQHLTAEKSLSGMDVKLRGAARLVEVKLKKLESGKKGLEAAMRVTEMEGGKQKTVKVVLTGEVAAMRKVLAAEALKMLEANENAGFEAGDVKAEAKTLGERASALAQHNYRADAIPLGEAAWALDPTPEHFNIARRCYSTSEELSLLEELKVTRRLAGMHVECVTRLIMEKNWAPLFDSALNLNYALAVPLYRELGQVTDVPTTPEQRTLHEIAELAEQEYQVRASAYHREKLWFGPTHASSPYEVKDGADFCRLYQSMLEEYDSEEARVARKNSLRWCKNFSFRWPDVDQYLESTMTMDHLVGNVRVGEMIPLFKWMTQQKNPVYRMQGWNALTVTPGKAGDEAATRALDIVFREKSDEEVHDEWKWPSVPCTLALSYDRLRQDGLIMSYLSDLMAELEKSGDGLALVRWPEEADQFLSRMGYQEAATMAARMKTLVLSKDLPATYAKKKAILLREMDHRIEQSSNSLGLADPTNPWDLFDAHELKIGVAPQGTEVLIWAGLDRSGKEPEWILAWRGEGVGQGKQMEFELTVGRMALQGGNVVELARGKFAAPEGLGTTGVSNSGGNDNGGLMYSSSKLPPFQITSMTAGPQGIFFSDFNRGVLAARDGKIDSFTEANGLASRRLFSLALCGGKLYAGLRNAILQIDPKTGQSKTLASSKSLASANPFDGGQPYRIVNMMARSNSPYLWIAVDGDKERNGVWRFDTTKSGFEKIAGPFGQFLEVSSSRPAPNMSWQGGRVMIFGTSGGLYDWNTGKRVSKFDVKAYNSYLWGDTASRVCVDTGPDGFNSLLSNTRSIVFLGPEFVTVDANFYPADHARHILQASPYLPRVGHEWDAVEPVESGFVAVDYGRGKDSMREAKPPRFWILTRKK